MNPGQAMTCKTCRHFHGWAWEQGHPQPCGQVRWDNRNRVEPELSKDGRECSDFEQDKTLQNHGLEIESTVSCHEADAQAPEIGITSTVCMAGKTSEPLQPETN